MVSQAQFDAHYHTFPTATTDQIRAGTDDETAMSALGFAPIYAELRYGGARLEDKAAGAAATIDDDIKWVVTAAYDTDVHSTNGGAPYRESDVSEVADYPAAAWFQTANGRYFLLAESWVSPLMLGAVGDGTTNDATAIQAARDFCATAGVPMKIDAYFKHTNTLALEETVSFLGIGQDSCGIYMDIDRTMEGINVLASNCSFERMEIKATIPATIQNGQGHYGTCVTVGKLFYAAVLDDDDALEEPALVKNTVIRDCKLTRGGVGRAAAIAFMGRSSGLVIENCEGLGASSTDGCHANFILTHWSTTGTDFPATDDGILIEPLLTDIYENSHTYHPNGLRVRNVRLRNCGRLLASTASYNIDIADVDYDGINDGSSSNSTAIISLQSGDETDRLAHPDDVGRVYSNFRFSNITGLNLVGTSANSAIKPLIDWNGGSATSKYLNEDGTLAEDDPYGENTAYNPPSLLNLGTTTVDVSVPGLTATMSPLTVWFSREEDSGFPSGYTFSAAYLSSGVARVTVTNGTGSTQDIATGYLTVSYRKQRYQDQPLWRGVVFENMDIHGIDDTINLIDIRNCNAFAEFSNISTRVQNASNGISLSAANGKFTFNRCKLPGIVDINASNNITFNDCEFTGNAILRLTVTSTTGFTRGDFIYGNKVVQVSPEILAPVRAVIDEVVNATTLDVRLVDTSWDALPAATFTLIFDTMSSKRVAYDAQSANFTVGKTLTGGTSGAKGVIMADDDDGTTGTLYLEAVTGRFQNNETVTDTAGGSALANILSTSCTSVATQNEQTVLITGTTNTALVGYETTGTPASGALLEGATTLQIASRLAYDGQTGNFTVPSTLTGGTSGATARIIADTDGGATGTLYIDDITGVFVDNETITDAATGSATSNIPSGVVHGFGIDIRKDDIIRVTGGTLYSNEFADSTSPFITIKPAPLTVSPGATLTLDRRSHDITFNQCSIKGSRIGVDAELGYNIEFNGGEISDCGLYGLFIDDGASVKADGLAFRNNGQWRVSISTSSNTRDWIVASGGTFRGDRLVHRDDQFVHYNGLVDAGAIGGHCRDSLFLGSPITSYLSVSSALTNGSFFDLSGNRNSTGISIDHVLLGTQAAQPASGSVTITETKVNYPYFTMKFTFAAARITVTDAGGSGSSGSLKLFDFAAGAIQMLGSRHTWSAFAEGGALTGGANDAAFVIAFGSAAANAGDGALSGTEVDFGATKSITLPATGLNETTVTGAQTPLDGTSTAQDLYLNWSGTVATIDANSTIDVTGSYTINGMFLGDD